MSRKRAGVEIGVTAGLLAVAVSGSAWARQIDLVPPELTYGEAVNCSAFYRAMADADGQPNWRAATFRMLAIEIDEWTNVDGDIGSAQGKLVWEAGGSADAGLAERLRARHGDLLARCSGHLAEMDRRFAAGAKAAQ